MILGNRLTRFFAGYFLKQLHIKSKFFGAHALCSVLSRNCRQSKNKQTHLFRKQS